MDHSLFAETAGLRHRDAALCAPVGAPPAEKSNELAAFRKIDWGEATPHERAFVRKTQVSPLAWNRCLNLSPPA
jgi:hypothetical protein